MFCHGKIQLACVSVQLPCKDRMNLSGCFAGKVVEEQQSLMELGIRPHSSTRMEMSSTDPSSHSLRPFHSAEHDCMPDVITVQVQKGMNKWVFVVVEIERSSQKKPFLGGYRHRLTGVEYHHAAVQTLPKKRPDKGVVIFSHHTQTTEMKCQTQQCVVSVSTQMTGIGCHVSCVNDTLVTPGKYITADEIHDRRLKAVICLQSFIRRWLAQQAVDRLKRERSRRLAWLKIQEQKQQEEKNDQLRDRHERWMNPQRKEDFNLLYHALESKPKSTPYQWRAANGHLLEMDTPHSIRARELQDLYNNISMYPVGKEQRHHFLLTLKDTVKEHDCQLTQDIMDLVNQEVDLMSRGVKAHSLEGLRKRICTLFFQYIKTSAFNPNVAKLLKVPQYPSQLKNDMFLCRGCHRYLRSADFSSSSKGLLSGRCHKCTRLDNIARSRDDFSLYKSILTRLRADEQRLSSDAKIPFLLQVEDMRYLIEIVWASRSALNGSSDLYNLVFSRWERQKDWSPWNCILLSKEETSAHLEVEDAYETTFICWIEHKHTMAQHHFSQIPTMANNQLGSRPITIESGKHVSDSTPALSH
uniref:IQ motif and ubiquitin domain containing n=1 Tax=Kryptolebias marmoratus TaxID=37003 RepID=A0A3Q3A929_KRYMA